MWAFANCVPHGLPCTIRASLLSFLCNQKQAITENSIWNCLNGLVIGQLLSLLPWTLWTNKSSMRYQELKSLTWIIQFFNNEGSNLGLPWTNPDPEPRSFQVRPKRVMKRHTNASSFSVKSLFLDCGQTPGWFLSSSEWLRKHVPCSIHSQSSHFWLVLDCNTSHHQHLHSFLYHLLPMSHH